VIDIHDLEIEIQNPTKALAEFTGSFDGLTKQEKRINEYRELECELKKIKGKWIIYRITLRQIIER